jgi:signal transduction histidine kinase
LKSRFATMVSHEFRTPLTTISLTVNHIKRYKDRLSAEAIDTKINVALKQVDHMSYLLEDILTLGKTQDTKIRTNRSRVDLLSFCNAIKEQVEEVFGNSHTIECSLSVSDQELETDENLLRNILVNLVSNAIKFSPGKSAVYVNVYDLNGSVVIDIKDEGIGILPDDIETIFEPFDRGTNVEAIPGTGLGLSIVKNAIDLVGGTISVKSKPGQGSVFSVSIPRRLTTKKVSL